MEQDCNYSKVFQYSSPIITLHWTRNIIPLSIIFPHLEVGIKEHPPNKVILTKRKEYLEKKEPLNRKDGFAAALAAVSHFILPICKLKNMFA